MNSTTALAVIKSTASLGKQIGKCLLSPAVSGRGGKHGIKAMRKAKRAARRVNRR